MGKVSVFRKGSNQITKTWIKIGEDIIITDTINNSLCSISISYDGNVIAASVPGSKWRYWGSISIFFWNGVTWSNLGKDLW